MSVHETLTSTQGTYGNTVVTVTSSVINEPDDRAGSSTVATENEGTPLTVSPPQGSPSGTSFAGPYGTIAGRFDKFNVINNPA